ncbi:glycerophosphodiester phosphodiesterase [Arthrobacter sp. QXT-31]|uniref:glycerophosphodiester phosphodiesterase n=1 Tax=Arthrobacter sp. QXT-31 TaxID=1357915 RepID=UPI002684FF37
MTPIGASGQRSSNATGTTTPTAKETAIKTNESNGSFDLQSHRGGRGEWTEESLEAHVPLRHPQMIAEAHEFGLPVIPWTVNTTADMAKLMDLGVDGIIITDYPTRLRTLMAERGYKLPKAYSL